MFRLNAVPAFKITFDSGTETKSCQVRFPNDREWCDRAREVRILRTPVGRDKFQSDAPGQHKADARLLNRILIREDGVIPLMLDEAEASTVIGRLDAFRIKSVERDGTVYVITAQAPPFDSNDEGQPVTFRLRPPTRRQAEEFQRTSMSMLSGRHANEFRSSLEPGGVLFDQLVEESGGVEGYAGPVPIIHKFFVVSEVIDYAERLVGDGIELPEEPSPAE